MIRLSHLHHDAEDLEKEIWMIWKEFCGNKTLVRKRKDVEDEISLKAERVSTLPGAYNRKLKQVCKTVLALVVLHSGVREGVTKLSAASAHDSCIGATEIEAFKTIVAYRRGTRKTILNNDIKAQPWEIRIVASGLDKIVPTLNPKSLNDVKRDKKRDKRYDTIYEIINGLYPFQGASAWFVMAALEKQGTDISDLSKVTEEGRQKIVELSVQEFKYIFPPDHTRVFYVPALLRWMTNLTFRHVCDGLGLHSVVEEDPGIGTKLDNLENMLEELRGEELGEADRQGRLVSLRIRVFEALRPTLSELKLRTMALVAIGQAQRESSINLNNLLYLTLNNSNPSGKHHDTSEASLCRTIAAQGLHVEQLGPVSNWKPIQLDYAPKADCMRLTASTERLELVADQIYELLGARIVHWAKKHDIYKVRQSVDIHRLKYGALLAPPQMMCALWPIRMQPESRITVNDVPEQWESDQILVLEDGMTFRVEQGEIEYVLLILDKSE
ncbi:hypothetical protein BX600DRAFT_452165 [Xylariales sp. PMI_506]|nr:hypothetical protein BX600DRAFT_452165 [Xylariales sp. PMI_506]